jgi:transcriptional regulator with XRE-family HTH domain
MELAVRAGLSLNTVALIEQGRRTPKWPTVCLLADVLNVSVADFRSPAKRRRGKGTT